MVYWNNIMGVGGGFPKLGAPGKAAVPWLVEGHMGPSITGTGCQAGRAACKVTGWKRAWLTV